MNLRNLTAIVMTAAVVLLAGCEKSDPEEEKIEPYKQAVNVILTHGDQVYVGTMEGLYILEEGEWSLYTDSTGLKSNIVQALAVDGSGNLWVGTKLGLSKLTDGVWTSYTTEDGLYFNDVRSLACDSENSIWIGTGQNRITKYDGAGFTHIQVNPEESGDPGIGHIHTITFDLDGNMWIGSCMTGLSVYDGVEWTHSVNNLTSFTEVSACDLDGEIWIGTYYGLFRFTDPDWTKYVETDGLASKYILSVDIDAQGKRWFGTDNGITKFDGAGWTNYMVDDGDINSAVQAIACDNSGAIWVGNNKGLLKFEPGQ